jgi:LCP family protein required for cell wall assembly
MKTRYIFLLLFFLLTFILNSCSFFPKIKPGYAEAELLLTPNSSIPLTQTPFQPAYNITSSPDIDPANTANPLLTPSRTLNPAAAHRTNILVLGSDWRPNSGYRTDVILLISLDKIHGNVSVVSFPRDLWVRMPGLGEERINTSMEYGGLPLTRDMFQENFGVRIDNYLITNFQGFISLVNYLGGLNINAGRELYDTCDLPQSVNGYCYAAPGINYMDGATALWYVRSRGTSDDFDRTRRAQEVLQALFEKANSLDIVLNSSKLFSALAGAVETDLRIEDILSFINLGPNLVADPARIRQYFIGSGETYNYIIPSTGAMVLLPNMDAVLSILDQAAND